MEIQIHAYDPTWPATFAAIKADLTHDLSPLPIPHLSIHHVGSTSIPHLPSKPIIDILILVPPAHFKHVILQQFIGALRHGSAQGGYHYRGSGGVQGRWSFHLNPGASEPGGGLMERHVYVAPAGGMVHRNYLALRDTLRREPALRDEYAAVKVEAAGGEYDNVMQYATRKNGIVRKILRRAGWGEGEIDEKEAQAVRDWPREAVEI